MDNIRQKQKTIKNEVVFSGIGVHSGAPATLIIRPNRDGTGIIFHHDQFKEEPILIGSVMPENAVHATVIKQKQWLISTIEHLMAMFHVLGITHANVYVFGTEVPILDGSALPFVHGILEVGIQDLLADSCFLTTRENVIISDNQGRIIELVPAEKIDTQRDCGLYIDYTADFANLLLGFSHFSAQITADFFVREIAPARTFGFLEQLPLLRRHGLARGASLGNTVVIGREEYLNDRRFTDECIRHKVLDLLGDLALLGKPFAGKIRAVKTGHSFNRLVIEHYLKNPELWEII
jgi:UDP-3-O-[3-hydroxymyristoyl] N-acetylglucosamine deacetylase